MNRYRQRQPGRKTFIRTDKGREPDIQTSRGIDKNGATLTAKQTNRGSAEAVWETTHDELQRANKTNKQKKKKHHGGLKVQDDKNRS